MVDAPHRHRAIDAVLAAWHGRTDTQDDWQVTRAAAGANGVVYRADHPGEATLAVKVTLIDERDRTGREWCALKALERTGLAPSPVSAERTHEVGVVAMRWCEGTPASTIADAETRGALAALLQQVHRDGDPPTTPAVLGVSPAQVIRYMRDVLRADDRLLTHAAAAAEAIPAARPRLIHVDGNVANLLLRDRPVLLDWESSGYGDPLFDVADVCAQPGAFGLTGGDVEDFVAAYDPKGQRAVRAWIDLLNHWWVARIRRQLDTPRPQLAGTVERSRDELERQLSEYERRAGVS